jgi:hypothetical protein
MKQLKINHYQQNGAKNCSLYAIANALTNKHVLNLDFMINEDGGGNIDQVSKILDTLELKLTPLYFSASDRLCVKDERVLFDRFDFDDDEDERIIMVMVAGARYGALNHMFAICYHIKLGKFTVIDSLKQMVDVYDTLDEILQKYNIFELHCISDKENGFNSWSVNHDQGVHLPVLTDLLINEN